MSQRVDSLAGAPAGRFATLIAARGLTAIPDSYAASSPFRSVVARPHGPRGRSRLRRRRGQYDERAGASVPRTCLRTPSPSSQGRRSCAPTSSGSSGRPRRPPTRGEPFPDAGTPEYLVLQNQAVDYLIQRVELDREAKRRNHGHRRGGRTTARRVQAGVLRRGRGEIQEGDRANRPDGGGSPRRYPRAAHLREDLRRGHEGHLCPRVRGPGVLRRQRR